MVSSSTHREHCRQTETTSAGKAKDRMQGWDERLAPDALTSPQLPRALTSNVGDIHRTSLSFVPGSGASACQARFEENTSHKRSKGTECTSQKEKTPLRRPARPHTFGPEYRCRERNRRKVIATKCDIATLHRVCKSWVSATMISLSRQRSTILHTSKGNRYESFQ